MTFAVRWPDGTHTELYSPSLVVTDHLEPGVTYAVADFVGRTRAAMAVADQRVREKYGFPCVRAASTTARVEGLAARFAADDDVTVTGFGR